MKKNLIILFVTLMLINPLKVSAKEAKVGDTVSDLKVSLTCVNVLNEPHILIGISEGYDYPFYITVEPMMDFQDTLVEVEISGTIDEIVEDENEGIVNKITIKDEKDITITNNEGEVRHYVSNQRQWNRYVNLSKDIDEEIAKRLNWENATKIVVCSILMFILLKMRKRRIAKEKAQAENN